MSACVRPPTKVVLSGSCVIDLPCLTVPLDRALLAGSSHPIEPVVPGAGGITCNTGIALQRLGLQSQVLSYVGDDAWGKLIRSALEKEAIDVSTLHTHPSAPTTTSIVLVDPEGQRSFLCPDRTTATKHLDGSFLRENFDHIAQADFFVLGYFGRMPLLEPELAPLLREMRSHGCRTVLESGGDGGCPSRLQELLPHLDIFVPSEVEAARQTSQSDPRAMIDWFRQHNDHGIVGVKLGKRGAVLHKPEEGLVQAPAIHPPGPVIDTTGAGDCFLAGLVAALTQGETLAEAARWANAAGALAVTARGGYAGIRDQDQLQALLAGSR